MTFHQMRALFQETTMANPLYTLGQHSKRLTLAGKESQATSSAAAPRHASQALLNPKTWTSREKCE